MAATCPPTTITEFGDSSRTIRHISRTLQNVHDDRRDADDVIVVGGQFPSKGLARRKIQHAARRGNIFLNQHDAPGAMKHAQREAALRAGDLIVVELHGIDGAAAKFVVLRVRPEDRTQQDASATSLWVNFHRLLFGAYPSEKFFAVMASTLQNYYTIRRTPKPHNGRLSSAWLSLRQASPQPSPLSNSA